MNYEIEVRGVATEHYSCEAESEEEARDMFESGKITKAHMTEVSEAEIVRIEEVD
jgi:hypothetical protein